MTFWPEKNALRGGVEFLSRIGVSDSLCRPASFPSICQPFLASQKPLTAREGVS